MKIKVFGPSPWYVRPGLVGYGCILLGIAALAVFGLGKMGGLPLYQQSIVFLGGAICLGYGLTRLSPEVFGKFFQFLGYFAGFSLLMAWAYTTLDKSLPRPISEVRILIRQTMSSLPKPDSVGDALADLAETAAEIPAKVFDATAQPSDAISADFLTGKVVSIADGDTLTILVNREQVKIRLAEIDTPEKGQPWGNRAKQALSRKVFGKMARVEIETVDRYGRTVGKVWVDDRDICREMVREGHAWVYRRYLRDRSLLKDERAAQQAATGLWGLPNPVPPWEWRRAR